LLFILGSFYPRTVQNGMAARDAFRRILDSKA